MFYWHIEDNLFLLAGVDLFQTCNTRDHNIHFAEDRDTVADIFDTVIYQEHYAQNRSRTHSFLLSRVGVAFENNRITKTTHAVN